MKQKIEEFRDGKEVSILRVDLEIFRDALLKDPEMFEYELDYSVPGKVKIKKSNRSNRNKKP